MNDASKICIVGEWLHGGPDEGIHNLAQGLLDQWKATHSARALRIGADVPVNRLFLSRRLRETLHEIRPDLIVYISPSSAKVTALFRAKVLKIYAPQSRVFVVATQPVTYRLFERPLLPLLAPDGVFVQSPRSKQEVQRIPCPVYFLPGGVDTSRFVPVDAARKRNLRQKYGVAENAYVIVHVGHVNRGRNVEVLGKTARLGNVWILLVGSTSTRYDEELARRLVEAGVHVVREFIPHIEEIYQLADAYIFPVVSEDAAIGVPLSVLEAMACNLPVIATHFGGLPWMFAGGNGFFYFDNDADLPQLISTVQRLRSCSTRQMVEPYDWQKVASAAMEMIRSGEGPR